MAISEETKQAVHGQFIPMLKSKYRKAKAERDEAQAVVVARQAEMDGYKATYDALTQDIAEPTPVAEPTT